MSHQKYESCPFAAAGFSLEIFSELGAVVMGPDGRCVCVVGSRCKNPDKRGDERCTLKQLQDLNRDAVSRRAWQGGDY